MALNKTPVYRNLRTRVTFLYLEYEDLIAVLLIAPVSFFLGSLLRSRIVRHTDEARVAVGDSGGRPILLLLTFKYGKPRGYLRDWWTISDQAARVLRPRKGFSTQRSLSDRH